MSELWYTAPCMDDFLAEARAWAAAQTAGEVSASSDPNASHISSACASGDAAADTSFGSGSSDTTLHAARGVQHRAGDPAPVRQRAADGHASRVNFAVEPPPLHAEMARELKALLAELEAQASRADRLQAELAGERAEKGALLEHAHAAAAAEAERHAAALELAAALDAAQATIEQLAGERDVAAATAKGLRAQLAAAQAAATAAAAATPVVAQQSPAPAAAPLAAAAAEASEASTRCLQLEVDAAAAAADARRAREEVAAARAELAALRGERERSHADALHAAASAAANAAATALLASAASTPRHGGTGAAALLRAPAPLAAAEADCSCDDCGASTDSDDVDGGAADGAASFDAMLQASCRRSLTAAEQLLARSPLAAAMPRTASAGHASHHGRRYNSDHATQPVSTSSLLQGGCGEPLARQRARPVVPPLVPPLRSGGTTRASVSTPHSAPPTDGTYRLPTVVPSLPLQRGSFDSNVGGVNGGGGGGVGSWIVPPARYVGRRSSFGGGGDGGGTARDGDNGQTVLVTYPLGAVLTAHADGGRGCVQLPLPHVPPPTPPRSARSSVGRRGSVYSQHQQELRQGGGGGPPVWQPFSRLRDRSPLDGCGSGDRLSHRHTIGGSRPSSRAPAAAVASAAVRRSGGLSGGRRPGSLWLDHLLNRTHDGAPTAEEATGSRSSRGAGAASFVGLSCSPSASTMTTSTPFPYRSEAEIVPPPHQHHRMWRRSSRSGGGGSTGGSTPRAVRQPAPALTGA